MLHLESDLCPNGLAETGARSEVTPAMCVVTPHHGPTMHFAIVDTDTWSW